jgi:GGDEF domain-containing protein
MPEPAADGERNTRQDITQTAVNCYLSTILSAAECLARLCPEVGIPYQHRWRRLPQRVGFDLSSRALDASGKMFQSDLERFADSASLYFGNGLDMVQRIGAGGAEEFDKAVQEAIWYANVLQEMAESMQQAADLDAAPEISERLYLQSEGLRKSARQVRNTLLPCLRSLAAIVRECRKILVQAEQEKILDADTGLVNSRGFRFELKNRYEQSQASCVLLVNCTAATQCGDNCREEEFRNIVSDLASRLADQFRPWDCVGRIGPRTFAVIFEGSATVARERSCQISRSVSGTFGAGISVSMTIDVVEVRDDDSLLTLLARIDSAAAASPMPAVA